MPSAVVAVGAALTGAKAATFVAGLSFVTGTTAQIQFIAGLAGALTTAGVAAAGGKLLENLADEPQTGAVTGSTGRLIAAVSSKASHRHIYGEVRVAGSVAYRHSKSRPGTNIYELFYQAQILSASEVSEIVAVYANEDKLVFAEGTGDGGQTSQGVYVQGPTRAEIELKDVSVNNLNEIDAGSTITIDGITFTFVNTSAGDPTEIVLQGTIDDSIAEAVNVLNTFTSSSGDRVDQATYSKRFVGSNETNLRITWDNSPDIVTPDFTIEQNITTSGDQATVTVRTNNGDGNLNPYIALKVETQLGADDQTANTLLLDETDNWTSNHRLRGRAVVAFRANYSEQAFTNGLPDISCIVKGRPVYDPRKPSHDVDDPDTWEYSANPALIAADYLMADFGGNSPESEINWDYVIAAANVCDESVDGFWRRTVTLFGDNPTDGDTITVGGTTFTFKDTATASDHIEIKTNLPATVEALVNVLEESTLGNIDDAIYFLNGQTSIVIQWRTRGAAPIFTVSASITSGSVGSSTSGPSQNRYECHGIVDTSGNWKRTLAQIVQSMAGRYAYFSGKWHIWAGAYSASDVSIDESKMVGDVTYSPRRSRSELFNTVRGTFIWPYAGYKEVSYPEVTDSAAVTSDGETLPEVIDMPFVNDPDQAQRIASIILQRNRAQKSFNCPLNLEGIKLIPGGVVALDFDQYDLSAQEFYIRKWSLDVTDEGVPAINVELEEEDSSIYDDPTLNTLDAPRIATLPKPNIETPITPTQGSFS